MPLKHIINVGDPFGRYTVLKRLASRFPGDSRRFLCKCSCGNMREVSAYGLYSGRAQSCGCLHREKVTRHGDSKSATTRDPLYKKWRGMKIRCTNKSTQSFKYYGARGISLFPSWNEYVPFREWALASGYQEGLQIDRINPNGNYEPSNCRWVARDVQDFNKRNTLLFNGEPLKLLCKRLGVKYEMVVKRISRGGWTMESALYTPRRPYPDKTKRSQS